MNATPLENAVRATIHTIPSFIRIGNGNELFPYSSTSLHGTTHFSRLFGGFFLPGSDLYGLVGFRTAAERNQRARRKFGSMMAHTSRTIAKEHTIVRRSPLMYCEDGRESHQNNGIQAAVPIRYCPYSTPAIRRASKATLSRGFIRLLASLSRSPQNSRHETRTQSASCGLGPQSIQEAPRQLPQRSFSSLLLGRKIMYFVLIALKYVKVGRINKNGGITW